MKKLVLTGILQVMVLYVVAQKSKTYQLFSPDQKNQVTISAGNTVTWTLSHNGVVVLAPFCLVTGTGKQPGDSGKHRGIVSKI